MGQEKRVQKRCDRREERTFVTPQVNPNRQNKVRLEDYPYREEIDCRLLFSELSLFDVQVLRELLSHSLVYPLRELASALAIEEKALLPTLERLSRVKLVKYDTLTLFLDKELRKYFTVQIERFSESDPDVVPGFDFIFSCLRKLPIQILPDWYAISRASDDIFQSIVDDYLSTPRIYEHYLAGLTFTDPITHRILEDLFAASDHRLCGRALRTKYQLSPDRFEELMLQLELNFVCCLSYREEGAQWKQQVTPFKEWRDYLRFLQNSLPVSVAATAEVQGSDAEFVFVNDLTALLKVVEQTPLPLSRENEHLSIEETTVLGWLPQLAKRKPYCRMLVERLLLLNLCEVREMRLCRGDAAAEWHKKSAQDQALALYRLPLSCLTLPARVLEWASERFFREMERSLKRIMGRGWIYWDDFVQGLTVPVGSAAPVSLKRTGKRWRYELPHYTTEELKVMHWALFGRLFEAGFIAVGTHRGRDCFQVTSFGRLVLGE